MKHWLCRTVKEVNWNHQWYLGWRHFPVSYCPTACVLYTDSPVLYLHIHTLELLLAHACTAEPCSRRRVRSFQMAEEGSVMLIFVPLQSEKNFALEKYEELSSGKVLHLNRFSSARLEWSCEVLHLNRFSSVLWRRLFLSLMKKQMWFAHLLSVHFILAWQNSYVEINI